MNDESIFRHRLLEGQVALVTGGGSGINLAIAERYAEHGAHVTLVGRTQAKLDEAVAVVVSAGGRAAAYAADVRDYAALAAACARTHDEHGEIDLLVCGAAGNFLAPAVGMSANGFKSVVDIDLIGSFNACRAAFEHLRKPGASVLCVSAVQGFVPVALQAHACAAKAGVDMLTRVLAIEWGPAGVRVNGIAPGPVDDTEGMRRLGGDAETSERIRQSLPLRRFASKSEIADLALFLASPAARNMTGTVVVSDGGHSLVGFGAAFGG